MIAFYYSPHHVGMEKFPPGYFKLAGFYMTEDPKSADCFILPCDIRHVGNGQLNDLPYVEHWQRHVFFSLAEYPTRRLPYDALSFRTDYNQTLRDLNPHSQSWCWGVEDLAAYVAAGSLPFEVHAQLWASSPITDVAVESCLKVGLRVHDQRNSFFYGTLETANDPRLPELRRTYLDSMSQSRLVLVPRSRAGVNRYRFYEAMSMGRIPVLLCDDCVLPCESKVRYEDCSIRISERDALRTGEILKDWLRHRSLSEILARGQYGRAMWEQWLAPNRWEQTWGQLTQEYLEAMDHGLQA